MPSTIPIQPNVPSQSFSIVLDSVSYNMLAKWNSRSEFWTLDIFDDNQNVIISDIALKAGMNLLAPFNFNIGALVVVSASEAAMEMTLSNVGTEVVLLYLTNNEIS